MRIINLPRRYVRTIMGTTLGKIFTTIYGLELMYSQYSANKKRRGG
jgi:hypothetical protein